MVYESLKAYEELKKRNLYVNVINMHTIKPLDIKAVKNAISRSKLIVSVEEHSIYGGLGSAIAEVIAAENNQCKLIVIGINDYYEKGGEYNYLKEKYGLSSDKIVSKILSNI